MLLYLKINNCFIFDKEVEFSLKPNMHQKRFINNLTTVNGISALKSAIIMGPNNTGKTNFVQAIDVIKDIMLNGKRKMISNLFTNNPICSFEIGFIGNNNEYSFEVKYDSSSEEYIYECFKEISYDVHKNRKERRIALKSALADKAIEKGIIVLDSFKVETPKTKEMMNILENLKVADKKVLLVVDAFDDNMILASRNIQNLVLILAEEINVLDVVGTDVMVVTEAALKNIEEVLK